MRIEIGRHLLPVCAHLHDAGETTAVQTAPCRPTSPPAAAGVRGMAVATLWSGVRSGWRGQCVPVV